MLSRGNKWSRALLTSSERNFYANRGMFPERALTEPPWPMINSTSQSPGDDSLRRGFGFSRSHGSFFSFVTKHSLNLAIAAIVHHLPLSLIDAP